MKTHHLFLFVLFSACIPKHNVYDKAHLYKSHWVVEQQPKGQVIFGDKKIEIIDEKGCTVWFKHKLQAPLCIEYEATVIDEGGPYDRVSDLNCFWMANDPNSPDDFFKNSQNRAGKFNNYHSLTQYYVGYGGHNNTKTRFRRYDGQIDRPLLPEHDLSGEKLTITPNKKTKITLIVKDNEVIYKKDGKVVFMIRDNAPYLSGYFGIRTVNNHMIIENLSIKHN